jgi:hypothetical protein
MMETLPPVHWLQIAEHATLNQLLLQRFHSLRDKSQVRHSHFFYGRFENLYIERLAMPEIEPLLAAANAAASTLLRRASDTLRCGFWFNSMQPGQRTSAHTHAEDDELLSAVYYVTAPENSGDLLLHDGPASVRIRPEAGMLVLFSPELEHEVESNRSGAERLSIAFNFGPA